MHTRSTAPAQCIRRCRLRRRTMRLGSSVFRLNRSAKRARSSGPIPPISTASRPANGPWPLQRCRLVSDFFLGISYRHPGSCVRIPVRPGASQAVRTARAHGLLMDERSRPARSMLGTSAPAFKCRFTKAALRFREQGHQAACRPPLRAAPRSGREPDSRLPCRGAMTFRFEKDQHRIRKTSLELPLLRTYYCLSKYAAGRRPHVCRAAHHTRSASRTRSIRKVVRT